MRCLTLNIWGAEAPLAARMAVLERGLAELAPDVVALQEVREIPGQLENQADTLSRALGYHHVFAPAMPFGGGHEGLAILSRSPIAGHTVIELPHALPTERRILLSARIDRGAGVGSVWVNTTHLNYRLEHGKQRENQVLAVDAAMSMSTSARATLAPQILLGDFNARPEADEIRWLRGLVTLENRRVFYQDAWDTLHPGQPGWTWAAANPYVAPLHFLQPNRRLDYIFVTPERGDGRGRIHSCRIVFDVPSAEGVYASDHFGLLAEIQLDAQTTASGS